MLSVERVYQRFASSRSPVRSSWTTARLPELRNKEDVEWVKMFRWLEVNQQVMTLTSESKANGACKVVG